MRKESISRGGAWPWRPSSMSLARPDVVETFHIISHSGGQAVAHRSTLCDTGVALGRGRLRRNAPVPRFRRTNASSPISARPGTVLGDLMAPQRALRTLLLLTAAL